MCNARTLSLIVGWFQIVFLTIVAIVLLLLLCFHDGKIEEELLTFDDLNNSTEDNSTDIIIKDKNSGARLAGRIIALIVLVIYLIVVILFVTGILQERLKLMTPYVYLSYIGLAISIVGALVEFIAELIDETSVGRIILNLFLNLLVLGMELLFFSPIYIHYQRMCHNRHPSERHRLNNSTPINRPTYVHGEDV